VDPRSRIDAIEALIQRDTGRGIGALFTAARGGLWGAASALAAAEVPKIGILTGFYVPHGDPPAAETDGPAGAALLALGLTQAGVPCRVVTDDLCHGACVAALRGAGVAAVRVDAAAPGAPVDGLIQSWRALAITHVIAIERCGVSADGRPRNMRGQDVGAHAAALDTLFSAGPWHAIAIGDGGNEVGMGSLPAGLIAESVAHGAAIACVTPADHLIVAGVSHWGAYALLAALAVLRPDWRAGLLGGLDPAVDQAVVTAMVADGPAVDGVTLRRTLTIDGLGMAAHGTMLEAVRAEAEHYGLR